MGLLQTMPKGHIRTWYEKHDGGEQLDRLKQGLNLTGNTGYSFDTKTGLFFRPHKIAQRDIGQSCCDFIFTRPSDLYYHDDVTKMVRALNGAGKIYTFDYSWDHKPNYWKNNPQPSSITHLTFSGKETFSENYKKWLNDYTIPFAEKNHETLEVGEVHAIIPDKDTYLEVRFVCSSMLDKNKEIVVNRFDKYNWLFSDHEKK